MLNAVQFYSHMRKFRQAYDNAMRPLSEELGIAQTGVDILLFFANNPGRETAKDVCAYLHMKQGIVSFHVDKLVNDGYLERRPVPSDRRKCRLECTEKAAAAIKRGREMQDSFFSRMKSGISEAELEALAHCLSIFENNLSQMAEQVNGGYADGT